MLSQLLVALHRELAAAAWRDEEVGRDQRAASPDDLVDLRRRFFNLCVEINRFQALVELAEHPELETGQGIGPGTAIEVVDAASGQQAEYRLVGCDQDSDSTVVSVGSAIGQGLLGRKLGSLVTLNPPDGMRRVRVVATRPIEAPGAGGDTDDR